MPLAKCACGAADARWPMRAQEITLEFHALGAVRDALAERGACLRRGQYDGGHTG